MRMRKSWGVRLFVGNCCLATFFIVWWLRTGPKPARMQITQQPNSVTTATVSKQTRDIEGYPMSAKFFESLHIEKNATLWKRPRQPGMSKKNRPVGFRARATTYKSDKGYKLAGDVAPNVKSEANIVLIVAYMRTGSTFTASILQEFPKSFYVFEPLRAMYNNANNNGTAVYLNGRERKLNSSQVNEETRLTLDNWLNCDLINLDTSTLTDPALHKYSKAMVKFITCYNMSKLRRKVRYTGNGTEDQRDFLVPALKSCVPAATNHCLKSKVRVFKSIRLRMKTVRYLMSSYPNMKVIHLLRDPRGVLDSWIRVNLLGRNDVQNAARQLCRDMYNDLYHSKLLLEKYPDRLMVLQYETLTEFPLEVAERMYKFTDLPFTSDVKRYVINMTSNSGGDSCSYCTQRGNSTITANKWRQHINQFQVKIINSECKQVYRLLGYKSLENYSYLKNTSLPSRSKIDVYSSLKAFNFSK